MVGLNKPIINSTREVMFLSMPICLPVCFCFLQPGEFVLRVFANVPDYSKLINVSL